MSPRLVQRRRPEFRQRHVVRDLLEDDTHGHLALYVVGLDLDEIADETRPFLQFDQSDHIGDFFTECRMIDAVEHDVAEDFSTAR